MLLLFYKGSSSNSLQTLVVIYLDWVDFNGHRSWNTFKYSSVTKCRLSMVCVGFIMLQVVFLPGKFHSQRTLVHHVHEITKSWMWFSDWAHTHKLNTACVSSFLPYPKSSFWSPASSPCWQSPVYFLFFVRTEVISLQPWWPYCPSQQAEHPFLKG